MAKHQSLLEQLHAAHQTFQAAVNQLVRLAKQKAAEEVAAIESTARKFMGQGIERVGTPAPSRVGRPVGRPKGSKNKSRIRRDPEQLRALAKKAVATIKAAGKNGISASNLKQQIKGIDGSVKLFIEKHTDQKVKQEGVRRHTRYRIA